MRLYKRVKELIHILDTEGIDEIEVRTLWRAVRVARRGTRVSAARVEPSSPAEPGQAVPAPEEADPNLEKILSPMVGTFYRSPNPDTDPFVFEGKMVERGEVLCIIEAMKLMNEIEAEKSGVIRKILVRDSEPVEYGQPLFLVESA
ncbi:MAG TPA: acetyl-CoA carboxylase biotin carboxyl carrier protein [Candidatus Eisenbacteria bacterium]|uniref:Biotin carboxyl carrier protein of acetyl-CoA carboxylase n=1 Tax=Eiseniibacteriota bacterium TaxID=2212470 RepID=A0A7V2ATV0_UNCEI|nr:acetyl-CoA carboxylase biotin carboxyl carrier protein [Candidatus Eisenbacteria bacterium]